MNKLSECFEELIDRIKALNRYELGRSWSGGSYSERAGGPDPDGEYVELENVIDLIKHVAGIEDNS